GPVGANPTAPTPAFQRRLVAAAGGAGIVCGHPNLNHPGLAAAPAGGAQIVGGRAECVGDRGDQIAAAVTVEIDRQPPIGGGNELRLSEGAGPGTVEFFETQVAVLDQP